MSGIRSLMGHPQGAQAAVDPTSGASGSSPWGGRGGELSRDAGLGDIGRASSSGGDSADRRHGALDDSGDDEADQDPDDFDDGDLGFDDGGDDDV